MRRLCGRFWCVASVGLKLADEPTDGVEAHHAPLDGVLAHQVPLQGGLVCLHAVSRPPGQLQSHRGDAPERGLGPIRLLMIY